ncbi:MAG: ATP-binding protein [Longimicrobiales bacterium]
MSLATAVLWWSRPMLDKAHMAMAFLLVVLVASARHGWRLGLGLAVLCFLSFNFFLLPPYYTFALKDPLDWLVLATFLATGAVAAHLFDCAQREADTANRRAEEIDRLSMLGAETLAAARAEQAVDAIARVMQSTLDVGLCEVYLWSQEAMAARRIGAAASWDAPPVDGMDRLFEFVVERSAMVTEHTNGTRSVTADAERRTDELLAGAVDARAILLPLRVRDRAVGVLRIADRNPIALDAAKTRFAAVLSYYAALGVERVRLAAAEERAAALRQADRLKDALLASVSHDLRTPLTTIKALAHELRLEGDARALAIEEEADCLNRLVANLLDLSRLNSGGIAVSPEVTAAVDLVGAALQRVAGMQNERRIDVSLPQAGDIPIGCFDFSQSLRILVNLLENALKYGPSGQPIDVGVRQQTDWLVIEVLDRGPGIPREHVDDVFQPFFRRPDDVPDIGGTGLGLAIARRLAEAQGGTVEYAPRPGGGSIFSLRLPGASLPELSEMS